MSNNYRNLLPHWQYRVYVAPHNYTWWDDRYYRSLELGHNAAWDLYHELIEKTTTDFVVGIAQMGAAAGGGPSPSYQLSRGKKAKQVEKA